MGEGRTQKGDRKKPGCSIQLNIKEKSMLP